MWYSIISLNLEQLWVDSLVITETFDFNPLKKELFQCIKMTYYLDGGWHDLSPNYRQMAEVEHHAEKGEEKCSAEG